MQASTASALFLRAKIVHKYLQNVLVAYSRPRVSKGSKAYKKARKYVRPEDREDKNYYGVGPHKKMISMTDSLSNRGFAREKESYSPPSNISEILYSVCQRIYSNQLSEDWRNIVLEDPSIKFKLLTECIKEFRRDIPSSYLCNLKRLGDVEQYYKMPVDATNPFDALVRDHDKLPQNLHVIPGEIIFNPETDTFFEGKTAFPGRKRIIWTKRGEEFEKVVEWPNL